MPMVALAVTRPMHSFSPRFGGRREACHGTSYTDCTSVKSRRQTSRPTNIDRPFDSFLPTTSNSGLCTPPPERRHEINSMHSQVCGPLSTQFEPPFLSQSNLPNTMGTFRSSHQLYQPPKIFDSPPSRRSSLHDSNSLAPPNAKSYISTSSHSSQPLSKHSLQTQRSRHNSLSSSAGMDIPPIINGQKISLPEFAAQACVSFSLLTTKCFFPFFFFFFFLQGYTREPFFLSSFFLFH